MPSEVGSEIDRENEKVVSLIMGGDRKAVDLLFASHIPQLRRTAAGMLANSDDSEDVVQDGLLLAYRKLNQFQGRAKFSSWLHRIVINAALTKYAGRDQNRQLLLIRRSQVKIPCALWIYSPIPDRTRKRNT
jgi:RNA polymerase sigma-70 factor (ECF subfamily)